MADVYAVKSGNWSDTTVWNTSGLPAIIDDVYSNNFTVYVDGDYRVSSVRNLSATSIARGGSFILNDGISLSANVIGGGSEGVFCVRFLSASPSFSTIVGNVSTAGNLVNVRQAFAVELSGTGTLNVYGSALGGVNNSSGTGVSDGYIQVNASGILNFFGDVQGSLIGNVYYGINNKSSGTVNIIGSIRGRSVAQSGVSTHVVRNQSTGTINITGNVQTGIDNSNIGVFNDGSGVINVRGDIRAGNGPANTSLDGARNNSNGTLNIIGDVYGSTSGNSGVRNQLSTGTVNITGNCFGGNTGSGVGLFLNNGTATVVGGALGGSITQAYGIVNNGASSTVTVIGNLSGGAGINANGLRDQTTTGASYIIGNTYGGQGTSTPSIVNASTGSIFLTGNCYGYGYIPIDRSGVTINGTGGYGIHNTGGGAVVVYGNVYSSNLRGDAWGIYNQAGGSVTVFGNAYGGNGINTNADGIRNISTSTGTIILSGSAYGGNGGAASYGVNNLSTTAIVRVKRAVGNNWGLGYTNAIAPNPGVFGSQTGSTFVEELECGPRGQWPTAGNIYFTPNPKAISQFETDTFQNYSLVQSISADSLLPPVSSVRQGTVYDLGTDTGTCIIPFASSVALNIPVDNTTGTATLVSTNVWNISSQEITDNQSIGGRLRNTLTANAAERLVNSFNLN
jgi:hypothetical protein